MNIAELINKLSKAQNFNPKMRVTVKIIKENGEEVEGAIMETLMDNMGCNLEIIGVE